MNNLISKDETDVAKAIPKPITLNASNNPLPWKIITYNTKKDATANVNKILNVKDNGALAINLCVIA